MWTDFDELIKEVRQESWAKDLPFSEEFWPALVNWLGERVLSDFLATITRKVDEIVEIDADLKEPEILEKATRRIVDFLGAHSASVRIYDPHTEQMLSYGSFPSEEGTRQTYIPLEGSVAGEVVRTKKTFIVSDILKEPRYRNKQIVTRKGVHSLMAIPLEITRFFPHERDTAGVIQIYFPEKGRTFSRLEIQVANLLAKRLGFVIARKKIFSMHRVNEKKESIVRHIFKALGTRGGIKMKDVFNRVIPELAYIVNLQSCALFSVTESLDSVVLEAGYPERDGYHSIGKRFPISIEPAFEMLLNLADYTGESDYDILTPSYILVADPRRSRLTSENMKRFATYHNINSILYIPLRVNGETTHFMTFDAIDQRQRYMEDEIEIFLFLGRELMKAQKMERLDDILHDFKNPAIATAGFARRLKQILERGDLEGSREQLLKYVDIVLAETSRLQELALSIYQVGEEQVVSLTEVLQRRFEINKEAIKEQLKQNVSLKEGPFDPGLHVRCYPIHLERIFDNLLNNATKAIPLKGGFLSIRTYGEEDWAFAEITNTGGISDEDRLKLLAGEGSGRGLYITYRIMRLIRGKLEIRGGKNSTTFIVGLPLHRGKPKD
jgi:signal transduction histidine kinase